MDGTEQSLIGACLSAGYALPAALDEGVQETDFASDLHRAIWRAMLETSKGLGATESLDALLVGKRVGPELAANDQGPEYLHALVAACPLVSNARQYAREVMDASLKRKVRGLVQEIQDADMNGGELLEALQSGAFGLERRPREAKTMSQAFEEVFHEVEHPTQATCSYPWREIEFATRGLRPGWLTYLAGESSQGKTAAALEIADHVLGEGKSVLFLSLEMSAFELAVRIAQRKGFDTRALYGRKTPTDNDWKALLAEIGAPKWSRLRIETVDTVQQIGPIIRRTKPDLVILDYIQLLDIGRDTRLEGTTKNSRALKMLARKHYVPIVALSQLSRAAREDRGKPPGLWMLRDSGALEQDADAVVFVWRKRGEDGEGLLPEGAFIVGKARMGAQGRVDFLFDGCRQTFTLLSDRDEFRGAA
jgi:replicative DNA helicase